MTDSQKKFCDEYLIDFNASRAYKVAYPNCKKDEVARANSSRLLTKANIKNYLNEQKEELKKRVNVTQEDVINELAKIAFADIRKLYSDTGSLKNIKDIDDDTAAALAGVETFEEYEGRGEDREYIGDTKKVKMIEKTKALDLLGKYFGIFKEKVEVEQTKPFEVNIKVKK